MGKQVLIICFVVVVIGGIGSIWGALVAALLIGLADTFGKVLIPEAAGVTVYLLMAAILLWRPEGLFSGSADAALRGRATHEPQARSRSARALALLALFPLAGATFYIELVDQDHDHGDLRADPRPPRRLHRSGQLRPRGVLRRRRLRARADGAEVRGREPVAHAAGRDGRGRRSPRWSSACSSCA